MVAPESSSIVGTPLPPPEGGLGTRWRVGRPAGRCAVRGEPIGIGRPFVAVLRQTPIGLERLDVAADAFDGLPRDGVIAHWRGVMPDPSAKRPKFVSDDVLCDLFRRLGDTAEPSVLGFRFLLGLLLTRKRFLTVIDTTTNLTADPTPADAEVWRVRIKGSEDVLSLVNPRLSEAQTALVAERLGAVLVDAPSEGPDVPDDGPVGPDAPAGELDAPAEDTTGEAA